MHNVQLASQCLVCDCTNNRVQNTSAYQTHQPEWNKYRKYSTHDVQSGIHRMLQRPGESQVWNPQRRGPNWQCHDDDNEEPPPSPNFFGLARYYCIETMYLCTMWCCDSMDKICKIRVTNKYFKVFRGCLSKWSLLSWLYMHWQRM